MLALFLVAGSLKYTLVCVLQGAALLPHTAVIDIHLVSQSQPTHQRRYAALTALLVLRYDALLLQEVSMLHAVILYSVGSPESLTKSCLRSFIGHFLSDRHVVKMPAFLWQPILRSFILPTRPNRLLQRYEQIFVEDQNPYLTAMHNLCANLEAYLNEQQYIKHEATSVQAAACAALALQAHDSGDNASFLAAYGDSPDLGPSVPQYVVRSAFAYTGEGLAKVIRKCAADKADEITVIPLFPQFSYTTTQQPANIVAQLQKEVGSTRIHLVRSFASHPLYIRALSTKLQEGLMQVLKDNGHGDGSPSDTLKQSHVHVLLTYHSLPQSYVRMGDPYVEECAATTQALVTALGLEQSPHLSVAYQSKMGPMPWLRPYLEDEVESLLNKGVQHLIVMAPGFSLDCLETLYDINIKLRELFVHRGGDSFTYIPALNDSAAQVQLLSHLVLHPSTCDATVTTTTPQPHTQA